MTDKRRIGRPPVLAEAVKQKIFADLVQGKRPGEPLPAEPELRRRYAASRNTVRRALAELEKKGALFRPPHGRPVVSPNLDLGMWKKFNGKLLGVSVASPYSALTDSFYRETLHAVMSGLEPTGIDLRLSARNWLWHLEYVRPAAHFASPEVVAFLFLGRQNAMVMESLLTLRRPSVATDFDASASGCDSYCFDNCNAGALLARRLAKLGHRRVTAIFEDPDKPSDKQDEAWAERRAGFLSEWRALNMPPADEILLRNRLFDIASQTALKIRLQRPPAVRPTAVLLPADWGAEATALAAAAGLTVPRDLTLVGCTHANVHSPLTGVRFDGWALGGLAVKGLLRLLRFPKPKKTNEKITRLKGVYVAGDTHAQTPDR
jgi:DNA-binding LacI/PurR family transcriptional regulator